MRRIISFFGFGIYRSLNAAQNSNGTQMLPVLVNRVPSSPLCPQAHMKTSKTFLLVIVSTKMNYNPLEWRRKNYYAQYCRASGIAFSQSFSYFNLRKTNRDYKAHFMRSAQYFSLVTFQINNSVCIERKARETTMYIITTQRKCEKVAYLDRDNVIPFNN